MSIPGTNKNAVWRIFLDYFGIFHLFFSDFDIYNCMKLNVNLWFLWLFMQTKIVLIKIRLYKKCCTQLWFSRKVIQTNFHIKTKFPYWHITKKERNLIIVFLDVNVTSALIGAWEVKFRIITDQQTDQPTNRQTNRPVSFGSN